MAQVNTTRRPAAFTLIELLVVIGIIALLLGILLPAFGRVQDLSRSAATQARVTSLADACEMFKQEYGGYPGVTRWPIHSDPNALLLQSLNSGKFSGSQVLAMCLLDYQPESQEGWVPMSTYRRDMGLPAQPDRRLTDLTDSAFDIDGSKTGVTYAVLDAFPDQEPILYYVARPGQVGVQGIYKWADNAGFGLQTEFHTFISREPNRPYRYDSFILIAPGIDRQWFTGDDNRNFGN